MYKSVYAISDSGFLINLSLKNQNRGGRGLKILLANSKIVGVIENLCHDSVVFFTTMGRCKILNMNFISELIINDYNILEIGLKLKPNEKICSVLTLSDSTLSNSYICLFTKFGKIKRISISDLDIAKQTFKNVIYLENKDNLICATLINKDDDIYVATRRGFGIRFNESDTKVNGNTARCVRAIRLERSDDMVIGMCAISKDETEDAKILTVSETGIGRRSELSEYRCQTRACRGQTNFKTADYGMVASVSLVHDNDDVILISSDGIVIRMSVNDISIHSRTSRGVNVMKVTEGERVVSATPIQNDDESEEDSAEE